MRYLLFTICVILYSLSSFAQYDHQSVFADESGEELITHLKDTYKPEVVLDYGQAKDVMYGEIYKVNDSVSCVYSGHTLYLQPNTDPSVWLYKNGSHDGINAEHTYPRSKGADFGNAKSDMYHLFPTRLLVNSDRGSLPFGEIPDEQTNFWYYLSGKSGSIPQNNIDSYSEGTSSKFEPREDHKGNVARAVFYFYTMYDEEASNADPAFFESMRTTLCDWHYNDPVDSLEWVRNEQIASYQSDKPNPFILDCSLVGRSYCDYIDQACTNVGTHFTYGKVQGIKVFPNPAYELLNVQFENMDFDKAIISLVDLYGKSVFQKTVVSSQFSGQKADWQFDIQGIKPGIYCISIRQMAKNNLFNYCEKLIIAD